MFAARAVPLTLSVALEDPRGVLLLEADNG